MTVLKGDSISIREMSIRDYEDVYNMWEESDGVCLTESDTYDKIDKFLRRNPGLSLVAVAKEGSEAQVDIEAKDSEDAKNSKDDKDGGRDEAGEKIIAAVLVGHDGRRGYLHHLSVLPEYRQQKVAKTMVEEAMRKLKKQEGIEKCHLFVKRENEPAKEFWQTIGWTKRDELYIYSKET